MNEEYHLQLLHLLNLWLLLIRLKQLLRCRTLLTTRRWWVKPHIAHPIRNAIGDYRLIFKYFQVHDEEEFQKFIH